MPLDMRKLTAFRLRDFDPIECASHRYIMNKHTVPFTLALTITVGCGTNPCDIGLLYENMTPEQQANCDQCSNANECTADETGGVEDNEVSCTDNTTSNIVECVDLPGNLAPLAGWVSRALSTCEELSQPFDVRQAGVTFDGYVCELLVFGSWAPSMQAPSNDGWHICWNPYWKKYGLAHTLDVDAPTPDWVPALTCSLDADVDAGSCPMGFVSHFEEGVTCKCLGSDDDCQPGTVCEGNYTMVEGWEWPRPTECIWDGGPFGAEVGPEVYGLTMWEDGIVIDGDNITVTPTMLLALWPQEGQSFALFNDGQSVDERGTITRCDSGALCDYLGLHVGERIVFESFDLAALLSRKSTSVEVVRPQTHSRWLTVNIEST